MNLRDLATDPRQYDRPRVRWDEEGLANSPTRLHMHYHLRRHLPRLDHRDVLDVGSGTGHLSRLLFQLGARRVFGIEPSRRNVRASRRFFPRVRVYPSTLEKAKVRERFEIAVVVMALEHSRDIERSFRRIRDLLEPGGNLYAVVGGFRYHASPRFGEPLQRRRFADGSIVVGVARPFGVLYDIIRPLRLYRQAAHRAGLRLREQIPLRPSPPLLHAQPKYRLYRRHAINRLLIFERPLG